MQLFLYGEIVPLNLYPDLSHQIYIVYESVLIFLAIIQRECVHLIYIVGLLVSEYG
ncbi:hypothetical protein KPC_2483 [Acinetobacter stercoris]|uniref:Uncharacterized protein n=1 Tax=Acinetobacter stercoris TaxID=2126983 RepID=A0A2U3N111_9GAMM|nr:hypothetical protein KPC_2483 [Acinetobacter stercoris]